MSVVPERFEMPRAQKVAVTVLAVVMLGISVGAAWFAWHGIAGADDPRAAFVGVTTMAGIFGLIGVVAAREARRVWHSAITVRDGGVEIERGDDTPNFITWGQIGGLKLRSALGGSAVLGQGGDRLFSIDYRLAGVGRLLHAIMVNGVFPKRSPILPYRALQSVPPRLPVAIAFVLGIGAFALLANTPAEVRSVVLMSFAAIALVVAGIAALVSRFGGAGSVTIDSDGITAGRSGTRRPWSSVQGAALAFVRGPKGELFPRVALQGLDGRWEPLSLQGTDLVELLAAINAAAPGKILAPPDQPLGLTNRLAFTVRKDVRFRIGGRDAEK
jgi:hypothetical protein